MDNIVSIHLPAYNAKTRPLYQHDYGQLLQISGIELPENFEAQFTNSMTKQTVTMLGSDNAVAIPDALLAESTDVICYVFLHHTEDDGETRYKIIIPVIARPKPSENTPTPVQQDIITQTIAALNSAVEDAQAAASLLENCTATATTLDPDESATASYNDGTFSFGIPKGVKGDTGATGADGQDGQDGQDGFSPVVAVTEITGGHEVTITDAVGNHTFDVMDGTTPIVPVTDVQINNTSIVNQGVANIPIGDDTTAGVFKVGAYGIGTYNYDSTKLCIKQAQAAEVKSGNASYKPITPTNQHESAFYGLAKAAGDTTQSASSNAVGTYTETAKSKIADMLNAPVSVSGATPVITGMSGVRYVCGEVSTISITPPNSGIIDVIFESGSTPTVLTVPNTVQFPSWFDATALEADTTYEINIMDGVYAAVMTW